MLMTRAQESIDRSRYSATASILQGNRRHCSYSSISSETAEKEWEQEESSQPIMSHSSNFSICRPSPLPLIRLFSSFFFSPSLLRLRRKCAVSCCTISALPSLHVNKCTYPKCITVALTGTSWQLSLIRVTLMAEHLPQLLSITTPIVDPLKAGCDQ